MKSINYNKFISSKITQLRLKKNLSARELSLKLNLSPGYINQIENGKKSISIHNLIKICDFFNISLSEFFFINNIDRKSLPIQQQHILELTKHLSRNQVNAVIALIESFLESNFTTFSEIFSNKDIS